MSAFGIATNKNYEEIGKKCKSLCSSNVVGTDLWGSRVRNNYLKTIRIFFIKLEDAKLPSTMARRAAGEQLGAL